MGNEGVFNGYAPNGFFDEMFEPNGTPRAHYATTLERLEALGRVEFERRRTLSDLSFRNQGITFTVYGDTEGTERTFPFDPVPRIIPAHEWLLEEKWVSFSGFFSG